MNIIIFNFIDRCYSNQTCCENAKSEDSACCIPQKSINLLVLLPNTILTNKIIIFGIFIGFLLFILIVYATYFVMKIYKLRSNFNNITDFFLFQLEK